MLDRLIEELQSEDKLKIQKGLEGLADLFPQLEGDAFQEAVQAVAALFYIDPMDHPELIPVLEQAEEVLAEQRTRVIPVILDMLAESDLKTHFHLAAVLGRMGYAAVDPLLQAYQSAKKDDDRVFLLYAFGKIRDPEVVKALPLLFEAMEDPNPEIRDTAARAVGKICEHVKPDRIDPAVRAEMFDRLMGRLSDRYAGVRSKAVRSLGKMARFGYLAPEQTEQLSSMLRRILGEDEAENWDVAYVVRAEAAKAKQFV